MVCGEAPGYGVPLYSYETRYGHANCIDDAYEDATFEFTMAVCRIAAKKEFPALPSGFSDRIVECVRKARSKERPRTPNPHQYVLPEFDINMNLPPSRKGRAYYNARGSIRLVGKRK